ncbi:MAG TPA: hypothetical protein VFH78_06370 [Candidatus Thermoplasmatota archaeon]|nr:hypothetical protein [Candidatus Thermoplasmatota archaeon]
MLRLVPLALALALALVAAPLARPQGALPPGCVEEPPGYRCAFEAPLDPVAGVRQVAMVVARDGDYAVFPVPVFDRTLASIVVVFEGVEGNWELRVQAQVEGQWMSYSNGTHAREGAPRPVAPASQTTLHVLDRFPGAPHRLNLHPYGSLPHPEISAGHYRILYEAEPLREGEPWPRPAATRDDPHLLDAASDTPEPALDIVAFWFDDAARDDGLFEAHLALADYEHGAVAGEWRIGFRVGDAPYTLLFLEGDNGARVCALARGSFPDDASTGAHRSVRPSCTFDPERDVLTARIPERAVGSPGVGVLFDGFRAVALRHTVGPQGDAIGLASPWDVADRHSYAFALGGPAVWDALNPRLAVPPEPWYARPLAAENVPDTLQVLGALFAAAAFLGGLLLVRARRRRLRALLAEVEEALARHRHDAAAGLLALGALEESFEARLRRGRISEGEYQIVSQRVATSAARLAMRRELRPDEGDADVRVRPR